MAKAIKKTAAKVENNPPTAKPAPAPAADLDRLIHDRVRLGILSALATDASLSFSELKKVLKATDGNLSVHARKLEDAGYIECRKGFEGRTPRTDYRLTREGRQALEQYVAHMEAIISHVKGG
ncbi:MAG: transcriptional regulator [Saccharospirillum sp.]|uniref:winged helix-turn-helix domain-containing protein n=1 Tax=Saccharospirillum sp. TaxID=2033801 RepID=UPI003297661D